MEETLIILKKRSSVKRYGRAFTGLYFLFFCGYLMFDKAAIEEYHLLFFVSLIGAFLALALFLSNTLWVSNKVLLKIDDISVNSNIKGNKLKLEWVKVSKLSFSDYDIVFYTDGGQKFKTLDLSSLPYGEVVPVREKIKSLCEYKNIVCEETSSI